MNVIFEHLYNSYCTSCTPDMMPVYLRDDPMKASCSTPLREAFAPVCNRLYLYRPRAAVQLREAVAGEGRRPRGSVNISTFFLFPPPPPDFFREGGIFLLRKE